MTGLAAQANESDELSGGVLPVSAEIDGTCEAVTVTFTNPNDFGPFFGDVRVDDEEGTDDDLTGEGEFTEGPLAGQDYGQRYQNIEFADTAEWTHSFEAGSGTHTIEARVARGPEQHSLIDWVTYKVDCGDDDAAALPDTGAGIGIGLGIGALALLAAGAALMIRQRGNAQSMIG